MGDAKRRALLEAERAFITRKRKAKFAAAWKYGAVGFLLAFVLLPFIILKTCYEEEKWPWQI